MRISSKGEYAAKAVLHLSLMYPGVVTIREVAKRHHMPVKYLERILLVLRRAGLLESRRGMRGGYRLARAPGELSVGEVVRAVDGRFSQSSCLEVDLREGHACPESDACGLRQVWQDVQGAMERILFETTFDDVKKRTLAGAVRRSDFVATRFEGAGRAGRLASSESSHKI